MTEDTKDKNLEEKLDGKLGEKIEDRIENEGIKTPYVPPWMDKNYHKPRGLFPSALTESFIFSFTAPYVIAGATRRMPEWHWSKNSPPGRTWALGLGIVGGSMASILPPIFIGAYSYNTHNADYILAYVGLSAVTNAASYLYEKLRKKPVIRYRDPFDDKPSSIGKY